MLKCLRTLEQQFDIAKALEAERAALPGEGEGTGPTGTLAAAVGRLFDAGSAGTSEAGLRTLMEAGGVGAATPR